MPAALQKTKLYADKETVLEIVSKMKLNGIFVEVGTYRGDFAGGILTVCRPAKLYCVDPYASYEGFKDAINDEPMEKLFADVQNRLSIYGDGVEFIRAYSAEAAARFADNSLDFVYIDGNHSYPYVKQDFEIWYPKLKSGGLLCGDDAVDEGDDGARNATGDKVIVWTRNVKGEPETWGHYGVLKAAREFTDRLQIKLHRIGTQCLIFKDLDVTFQ